MHTNETPQENRESSEVSAAEVPINHLMDINDSDSDFEEISSDDENNRDYQLLAPQEGVESSDQQTVYYPHSYTVEWVDWDQYEQTLEEENAPNDSNSAVNTSTERTTPVDNSQTENPGVSETTESSVRRPIIALTDDRIDVIKTLMTGFTLPKDNIPVWAQQLPEEEWKELLSRKLDNNKVEEK